MPAPLLPLAVTAARVGGSLALRAFTAVNRSRLVAATNRAVGSQIARRESLQRLLGVKPYPGSTTHFYSLQFNLGITSSSLNFTHAGALGGYTAAQISAIAGGALTASRLAGYLGLGALGAAAIYRPGRLIPDLDFTVERGQAAFDQLEAEGRPADLRRGRYYGRGGGGGGGGGFSRGGGNLGDGGGSAWLSQNFDRLTYDELYERVNSARRVISVMLNIIRSYELSRG